MFHKLIVLVLLVALATQIRASKPLKVSVVYQPMHPYSDQFIGHQLVKNFEEFADKVQWDLTPYSNQHMKQMCLGNNGDEIVNCPHFNKIDMCAIYQLCGERGTLGCPADKLEALKDFSECMIDSEDEIDKCADDSKIDMRSCMVDKNLLGKLFDFYASKSKDVHEVPYISFNDIHNEKEAEEARKDLRKVICSYKPDIC